MRRRITPQIAESSELCVLSFFVFFVRSVLSLCALSVLSVVFAQCVTGVAEHLTISVLRSLGPSAFPGVDHASLLSVLHLDTVRRAPSSAFTKLVSAGFELTDGV